MSEKKIGFTEAYENAAKEGSAEIKTDKGLIDHIEITKKYKDPSKQLREIITDHIVKIFQEIDFPKYLDVGCSVGSDIGKLIERLGNKYVQIVGIDLLEAQLHVARERYPDVTFIQGNVINMHFEENEFDFVHASRLLIHVPNYEEAIKGILRVMKPGASGVFVEGDFRTSKLLCSDEKMNQIYEMRNTSLISMIANPNIAMSIYQFLLRSDIVKNVELKPFPFVVINPEDIDPELIFEKSLLHKLVKSETILQENANYYLSNIKEMGELGNFVQTHIIFAIHFMKNS